MRLGIVNRCQHWGVTAAGAEYAGLTNVLVFDSPTQWWFYKPSEATIQAHRLTDHGCSNG